MKFITFLTEFVKHPKNVGAIAPSSNRLAKKMVGTINFEEAKYILELGPGTGAFTKEIIKRKKEHTIFILIEINEVFYENLQKQFKNDSNVFVIHGSAENIKKYIKELQIEKVDYILSGLPFTSLPIDVSSRILSSVMESLREDGEFITFQYSLAKKAFIQHFFQEISFKKVWLNLPPAHVFNCRKRMRGETSHGVT
ncbi:MULTISPECIES: class I SAM-dependent methyltransferase [unclassified Bacillus cereus group]|uniref:class I SAM-dependent methyltransferase n=1 Tax=unclassified Bacillus cereus group TaxID=2750818 RepID=UPI001F574EC5|nr:MULTISPECIES: rRNA adenine N-6-methyltransferase family protein [unclassified Bacillus cereus group]